MRSNVVGGVHCLLMVCTVVAEYVYGLHSVLVCGLLCQWCALMRSMLKCSWCSIVGGVHCVLMVCTVIVEYVYGLHCVLVVSNLLCPWCALYGVHC